MPGNEIRFQQLMNQGHSAAWEQLWDRAAAFYRMALEEFPNNPKTLTNLGLALYELQDYPEALTVYQKAIGVMPDDPLPMERAAELYEFLGEVKQASEMYQRAADLSARNREMDKAINLWNHAIRLNPEYLLAHSRLALVFERLGRKQEAVAEYLAMASLLQNAGDPQKAGQVVEHAIQLAPGNSDVVRALAAIKAGKLLPMPGRGKKATAPLPSGRKRRPELAKGAEEDKKGLDPISETRQKALAELAGLLFDQEDEEQVDQTSRRGLQAIMHGAMHLTSKGADRTKVTLHLSQAVDLQSREKYGQAAEELERAVDSGLDNAAVSFDLGYLMTQEGRLESAVRHLQRAVKHAQYALGARLLLGQTLQKMNRYKEAVVEYLEALKIADTQLVPAEQRDELKQLYDPIIEVQSEQPADVQAGLCKNVAELIIRPDWKEHLTRARQQLPAQPGGGPPLPLAEMLTEARGSRIVESITLIHQLSRAGHFRAAMEEAYYSLQFAPTYLPLHTFIGELLLQQGHVENAIAKFTVVARSYNIRGDAHRSTEMYRRILEFNPMDMGIRNRLIEQLIALGQSEEAIGEYLKLAEVFYNQADLTNARQTYTQALALAHQSNASRAWKVKTLHSLADIDLQSLDWRQALKDYEQIRNLQPDDEKARLSLIDLNFRLGQTAQAIAEADNYVSYMWNNDMREQAIKFLEKTVAEDPKQPALRRRLAEMYRQVGRNTEALSQLDAAGELMMDAGDQAGAVECLKAILALKPPNAAEYEALLNKLR